MRQGQHPLPKGGQNGDHLLDGNPCLCAGSATARRRARPCDEARQQPMPTQLNTNLRGNSGNRPWAAPA
eukprot:10332488-Alexandrium_andersonii.AAC.1